MFLKNFSALLAYYLVVPTAVVISNTQQNIPLCPQKETHEYEFPYVVYGNSPAHCYVASRQGPCAEGSVLFAKPKSHFGVCSCECFLGDGIVFDDSSAERYRYCFNKRTGNVHVYDQKRCACYKLGSQGPCPAGQVLQKDIYEQNPKCVSDEREDISNQPHTPIEEQREKCPPGTIYSTLLNICTDMNFHGLSTPSNSITTTRPSGNTCPPGTIYSTLLNICTDMSFTGLPSSSGGTTPRPTGNTCPPGTIYSTLLNICTDMSFTGLPSSSGGTTPRPTDNTCPPGTIYSTLLNICTDMSFTGLPSSSGGTTSRPTGNTCPPGTIYSTLLNICTDMSFTGLPNSSGTTPRPVGAGCPPGTIYSTLLNICTDMNFKGLKNSSSSATSTTSVEKCPQGTIYSTLLNRCTDMSFRGLTKNSL